VILSIAFVSTVWEMFGNGVKKLVVTSGAQRVILLIHGTAWQVSDLARTDIVSMPDMAIGMILICWLLDRLVGGLPCMHQSLALMSNIPMYRSGLCLQPLYLLAVI